jgi:flagellar biosynthesis protein
MKKDPNKIDEAIALRYQNDDLPRVVAKGKGVIAHKILAIAKEANIPIHQDATLTSALASLELNEAIPRELFLAVAQVLVFAYNLSGKSPVLEPTTPTVNQSVKE